jgi:uncharacterized RDD family membrane protein YckC
MRIVPKKSIFCFVVFLLPCFCVFAAPNPPAPGLPPPPPGTPIDGSIWILTISSILFGYYKFKKNINSNKKASK